NPLDWMSFLNPRVDRIVCVAEPCTARRRARGSCGAPPPRRRRSGRPAKLVTIYKGHDLDWYRAEPLDLSIIGVPRGAFVVTCVANVRPRKGIPVLIRSAEHLPAGLPIH